MPRIPHPTSTSSRLRLGAFVFTALAAVATLAHAQEPPTWTPLLDPTAPVEDVVVRGTASTFTYDRFSDPSDPESSFVTKGVIVLETEEHGLVTLDLPGYPTVEPGSTITASGGLNLETRLLRVHELLAIEAPAEEAAASSRIQVIETGPDGGATTRSSFSPPGNLKLLVIPIWCSQLSQSAPASPTPQDYAVFVNKQINRWFDYSSMGQRKFIAQSTPWLDVCPSQTSAWLIDTPQQAARNQTPYDPDDYDRVVIVWAHGTQPAGIAENLPGRVMLVDVPTLHLGLWVHELGHLEGLVHANGMLCQQAAVPTMYAPGDFCSTDEYGDPSSAMGDNITAAPLLSSADRDWLGWLPPGRFVNVGPGSQSHILAPMSDYYANGPPLRAVKVELPSGTYYVEQRVDAGLDAGLFPTPGLVHGIQLRVVGGQIDQGGILETRQMNPNLLDGRLATWPDHTDAALDYGDQYFPPEGGKIFGNALQSGFTEVYTVIPNFQAPSQPRDVKAIYFPLTGKVIVKWLRPTHPSAALPIDYVVRHTDPNVPGTTITASTAASESVVLGPISDGVSAFEVSASIASASSEFAASNLIWAFPMTQGYASPPPLVEGSSPWTYTHTVTFPWAPPNGATRQIIVMPPSSSMHSHTPPQNSAYTITPTALSVDIDVTILGDTTDEPDQSFTIAVLDRLCMAAASYPFPECMVLREVGSFTISDDDP